MKDMLENIVCDAGATAIAVSGGIDSLTLAVIASRVQPATQMFHAVSPAVPETATQRVKDFALEHGWNLHLIDAEEFADQRYRDNPINRCYFCKSNLYGKIAALTQLTIFSGTNLDDLSDFRPGLQAAKEKSVRHPYVESGIDKSGVRALARELMLSEISELPASPCLSSRVSTGLKIREKDLHIIDRVEGFARDYLGNIAVRCRLSQDGFHLEVAGDTYEQMLAEDVDSLLQKIQKDIGASGDLLKIVPYARGSAFIHGAQ